MTIANDRDQDLRHTAHDADDFAARRDQIAADLLLDQADPHGDTDF